MSYLVPSASCARARRAKNRIVQLSDVPTGVVVVLAHLGGKLLGVQCLLGHFSGVAQVDPVDSCLFPSSEGLS
jgi:hypothetical protein